MNTKRKIQDSLDSPLQTQIVSAARKLFERFGFAKTSMQEIAHACGMSAANLYRFYEGKLAIGAAVVMSEQTAGLEACDQAVKQAEPNASARLVALFQCNIDVTRRKIKRTPLLFELSMIAARENQELRRNFLNEFERRIAAILLNNHQPTAFESAEVKLQSRMILMASAPFVLPWILLNEPFGSARSMVEPLVRSLMRGLAGNSPVFSHATAHATPANQPDKKRRIPRTKPGKILVPPL